MRYYKKIEEDKLLLIGIGDGGEEISREEYEALREKIRNTAVTLPESIETEDYSQV